MEFGGHLKLNHYNSASLLDGVSGFYPKHFPTRSVEFAGDLSEVRVEPHPVGYFDTLNAGGRPEMLLSVSKEIYYAKTLLYSGQYRGAGRLPYPQLYGSNLYQRNLTFDPSLHITLFRAGDGFIVRVVGETIDDLV
jgi:hypothetical protein